MQPGVTAALWLGPAQEYARYWIDGEEAEIEAGIIETFADAAWAALRAKPIEEDDQ
jgi:hypothetical protein